MRGESGDNNYLPITSNSSATWAYDAGDAIEAGNLIISKVEQDFGYGIRQQYFHKSVILILYHDCSFTKGILLNRPNWTTLQDEKNYSWPIEFGGEVQGLSSNTPQLVCLHRLSEPMARSCSIPIIEPDLWSTDFGHAQKLVQRGLATPQDFSVFCGYAGWGAGQLTEELVERDCWHIVATKAQTKWDELKESRREDENDGTGVQSWRRLMRKIGRSSEATMIQGDFDDAMLHEWANRNLRLHKKNCCKKTETSWVKRTESQA